MLQLFLVLLLLLGRNSSTANLLRKSERTGDYENGNDGSAVGSGVLGVGKSLREDHIAESIETGVVATFLSGSSEGNDSSEGSSLEVKAEVEFVNDCGYDAWMAIVYQTTGNRWEWYSWPFLLDGETLIVSDVIYSDMYIYGLRADTGEVVWNDESGRSFLCLSDGTCMRRINVGHLDTGYVRYDLCEKETIVVPPPEDGLSALASQWLHEHNVRRATFFQEHGLSALDMYWSHEVEQSAQQYAELLLELEGCDIQHGYKGNHYGGENLAINWSNGPNAAHRTPAEVLTAWFDDEIALGGDVFNKLHATQVAFRSSHHVGCGRAEKQVGGGKCFIQVCRYVAGGNCFADLQNWLPDVLSEDRAQFCVGPQCPSDGKACNPESS